MGATEKWDESAFALINKNGIMRLAWITYMLGRKGNSRLAYTHETYAMMIERIILAKRYVCVWQITTFLFGWWLDIHMICCEPLSLCIQFEWWTNLYEMLVDAKYWIIWYQHNWWIACNWSKHKGKSQQGSVPALCCHLPHILVSSIFFFFVLVQFTCLPFVVVCTCTTWMRQSFCHFILVYVLSLAFNFLGRLNLWHRKHCNNSCFDSNNTTK